MARTIRALTDSGYETLVYIARESPQLFRAGDPVALHDEMQKHKLASAETFALFSTSRTWQPQRSLSELASSGVAGPSDDTRLAVWLWTSLPTVQAADMADHRVLASINCFHLGRYVDIRWGMSSSRDNPDKAKQSSYVMSHWLGASKESNTAARLWWLYEFARRAADHTDHYDTDALLDAMAGHVNFYHPLLKHPYLMASDRVRAAILEVSIQSGLVAQNRTAESNKMLRALNHMGGAISLDVLTRRQLREHVGVTMPPKVGGTHGRQR